MFSLWRAFTLIELLVVVAVAALLVATAVPMQLESPVKKRAILCMHNCKQLATGYLMYALDNHDVVLASAANTSGVPVWVRGNVATLPDAVDDRLITESPTFPYLGSQRDLSLPGRQIGLSAAGSGYPAQSQLLAERLHGAGHKPGYR